MIRVTRAEAVRNIEALLAQAAAGTDIIVDSETASPVLIQGSIRQDAFDDVEHLAWCKAQMEEGLIEANSAHAEWVSNEGASAEYRIRRDELIAGPEAKDR